MSIPCEPGCCSTAPSVNTPGVTGATGAPGADAIDGSDGFTTLKAPLTIPAIGVAVNAEVDDTGSFGLGQAIFMGDGAEQGTFYISGITDTNNMLVTFVGAGGDSVPTAVIASGGIVTPSGLPIAVPLTVATGGTAAATLTDRSVLIGRGAAAVEAAVPGANPQPLLSTGSATNPAFASLDITNATAVTGILSPANGGTGVVTLADRSPLVGRGASPVEAAIPGADPQPLISTGAASNPVFGPLDLAAASFTGLLDITLGGTGATSLTDRSILIGRGAAAVELVTPGLELQALRSTGAASNPAFGAIDLNSSDVIGAPSVAHGGTSGTSKATALTGLGIAQAAVTNFAVGTAYTVGTFVSGGNHLAFGTSGAMSITFPYAGWWNVYWALQLDFTAASSSGFGLITGGVYSTIQAFGFFSTTGYVPAPFTGTREFFYYGPYPALVSAGELAYMKAYIDSTWTGAITIPAAGCFLAAVPIALT